MSVRIVDLSAALVQTLSVHLADNLGAAAELYRAEIQYAIGIQGPPRSKEGQLPHRDSGDLQGSIEASIDADNLIARVGSDMPYSPILELHMDRAYFVPTLIDHGDAIGARICKPR